MGLKSFFQKLTIGDKKFFPMFEMLAANVVKAAISLNKLFVTDDFLQKEKFINEIRDLENNGDIIARNIFNELDKTFITPIEREDIHALSSSMEEVLDLIYTCSHRMQLYKPKNLDPDISQYPSLIVVGCKEIEKAVKELKNLRKHEKIRRACTHISELEKQCDDLYHIMISDLFEKEKDAIELIKKKDIIQNLESIMDCIDDVADVLKTILLKMA
jgi:predicted phosphate transport protein (TIGR00153 family)